MINFDGFAASFIKSKSLARHSHKDATARRPVAGIAYPNTCGKSHSEYRVAHALVANEGTKVLVELIEALAIRLELLADFFTVAELRITHEKHIE